MRGANAGFSDHVGFARRMDIDDCDDRRRLRKTALGVEAVANSHLKAFAKIENFTGNEHLG
jgi:hypothetical protein